MLAQVLVGRDLPASELPLPRPGLGLTSHRGRGRLRAFAWSLWYVPEIGIRHRINFQIHMQWSTAIPSLLLKKIGFGNHYLVLIHGAELLDPGRAWLRVIKSLVLRNADAVVAGSHHTAEILGQQRIRCRRLEVIPYGNPLEGRDLDRIPIMGNREVTVSPRLLCMHRLVARKGTALLLDALAALADKAWTLDIVGKGEEEANLRSQAERLGLSSRVTFHPPVDAERKIRLMAEASLFILPSLPPMGNNHFEGLGLTLLEAQSLGVPVLAARTGGIPEAIQEGLTGVLFRAGDAEDLRSKLGSLLRSPDKRARLGQAGPAWVRGHFSWTEGLERLAAIMSEVAKD